MLVQAALLHAQFEAIHPFLDGNGRVGRLLITLFLIERKVLPTPLLYLSAFLEATRSEYYDRLQGVHARREWEPWLFTPSLDTDRNFFDVLDPVHAPRTPRRGSPTRPAPRRCCASSMSSTP